MIYIIAVRLEPSCGSSHEHIAEARWRNPQTAETKQSSKSGMVDWINAGGDARVRDQYVGTFKLV